jgi:ribose 5-phosphate isomerase B
MKISIGSDHRGLATKTRLCASLKAMGHEVFDEGTHDCQSTDYPDYASAVAGKVSRGEVERGILICATGIGMAITANKFPGVRAATCYEEYTAEMCRRHNDVNVLCLSEDLVGERRQQRIVDTWMQTAFEAGRHQGRLDKIASCEKRSC